MKFLPAILLLLMSCGSAAPKTVEPTIPAPTRSVAKIVATYPHDPGAYTQGLLFDNGKLYESVGQYGHSDIRIVDLKTGRVEIVKKNDNTDFGEGIAIVADNLYQLTWQEGKAHIYSPSTLARNGARHYSGEGWGLTSNADTLYLSDGSPYIRVIDPTTFKTIKTIEVRDNKGTVDMINELEYINGLIYANIYTTTLIAAINPATGIVEKYIDCSLLPAAVGNPTQIDFLNGIAYDKTENRILVTGKLYDTIFEVTF